LLTGLELIMIISSAPASPAPFRLRLEAKIGSCSKDFNISFLHELGARVGRQMMRPSASWLMHVIDADGKVIDERACGDAQPAESELVDASLKCAALCSVIVKFDFDG